MQVQMLQEFLVLAETLNFLSAASDLYISQATLSKHIREMEKELGAPLFKRTTRKVELTELGVRTIPYARKMVELFQAYTGEVEEYKERLKNSLAVGCINHWDVIDLGKLTMDFRELHPATRIQITTGESDELLSMLQQDTFHFVIVREEAEPPEDGLSRVPLCEDPLFVFLPRIHPLAGRPAVSLEELRGDSFIMGADGSLSHRLGLRACGEAGFQPSIIYQGTGPQVMNYITHGLGVGLMFSNPTELAAFADAVVCVPLELKVAAHINIAYKEDRLTDPGRAFLSFLKGYQF